MRAWVIEGKIEDGWFPVAGELFTKKPDGYRKLKAIRAHFPNDKFRLEEYVRKYLVNQ